MKINAPAPPNGNGGIVPPWLTHPVPPAPTPERPWWIDGDWDQPRR